VTIQGGGGRGVPPGGPPKSTSMERAPVSTPSVAPVGVTSKQGSQPPSSSSPARGAKDGFEAGRPVDPRLASEPATLPVAEHASHSGIESTIRLLEARRDEILDDHRALREQAWKLVGELARGGFDRVAVDARRAELAALRERLAYQRRRLQQIRRRLRTAMQRSSKHGDVDVSRAIQAHLEKMKKLEPGVQKALHALVAMEQAFAGALDAAGQPAPSTASPPPTSLSVAHGDALAQVVSGAVVAVGVAQLLASSSAPSSAPSSASKAPPSASAAPSSASAAPSPSEQALRSLRAFADQILSSL